MKVSGVQRNILFTFQVIDGFLQLGHRPFGKLRSGLSLLQLLLQQFDLLLIFIFFGGILLGTDTGHQ